MVQTGLSTDRLAVLIGAAAAVVSEGDLDSLLCTTVETARAVTAAPYAALGVIGTYGSLIQFVHEGLDTETVKRIGDFPKGRGLLGTVVRERRTIMLDDLGSHPDSVGFPPNHPPMRSFLGVPVRVGDEVYGNLYLTDKSPAFTEEDRENIEALATVAGAAISRARVHDELRRLDVVADRERIALDLHDSVIQDLFAVGLTLQGLSQRETDPGISDALIGTVGRIDACIDSLRQFIFDTGTRDDDVTFGDAAAELIEELSASFDADVDVVVDVAPSARTAQREDLMLVLKEAASNVLRHAQASTIHVSLRRDPQGLVLAISDDGVGFDPATVQRGMGLANLQTRVENMRGTMAIQSEPGRGTTVYATIPTKK